MEDEIKNSNLFHKEQIRAADAVAYARNNLANLNREFKLDYERILENEDGLIRFEEKRIMANFEVNQAYDRFERVQKALGNIRDQRGRIESEQFLWARILAYSRNNLADLDKEFEKVKRKLSPQANTDELMRIRRVWLAKRRQANHDIQEAGVRLKKVRNALEDLDNQ